jgi:DNA invertase Pin-like site-specific DNA recombinase
MALAIDFARTLDALETWVIGYVRVSDPTQLDSNSIEQQASEIERWCRERDYKLKAIYLDPGISGSKLRERQGLIAAIQRAKSDHEISGIVFFNFDRYFRDLGHSETIRKSLQAAGKDIFSTEQQIDLKDKYGVFNFQIQQAVAELKRKEILELLYKRRMAKVARGGWVGGRAPYGKKPQQGELVDDRNERRSVRLIRRLRKWVRQPNGRHWTYAMIADYLNDKLAQELERGLELSETKWAPKHARPLLRKRIRPYKKKPPLKWTGAIVGAILCRIEQVVLFPNRGRPKKNVANPEALDPSTDPPMA